MDKMDNEKVERLIEIVQGHQFLYDVCHHQYKNAPLKAAMWESIGKELNESAETVRSKWKTIRDGYTKYKKQLKIGKPLGKKNPVGYTWAPLLAFLDDYTVSRVTNSNEDSQSNLEVLVSPLLPLLTQDSPSPIDKTSSRKRSTESRETDYTGRHLKKKKHYDVIDNLFLSYADTFKRFPAREQAIVKLELAKLFSSTELKLLDDNSFVPIHYQYASSGSPTAYSTD